MTLGLLVTAAVAWTVANSEPLQNFVFGSPWIFYGILIGQFVLVLGLSAAIQRLSAPLAMLIFFVYAAMNGLVFSSVFLLYTLPSVAATFVATAGMFGVMSIIGMTTGMDLTKLGNIAIMALI